MPTALHESPADWMYRQVHSWTLAGLLSLENIDQLEFSGKTVEEFCIPFVDHGKVADFAIFPYIDGDINGDTSWYPSIVLETGLSESRHRLREDCALWMVGAAGAVKVLLAVKIFAPTVNGRVKVTLTIFRNLQSTSCDFSEFDIFPVPYPHPTNPVITIHEMYAGYVPAGFDSGTCLPLDLEPLRWRLRKKILEQGWLPA
ncbi:hypothetical protein L873DRAFT_365333 [Choiromyces venosus 120613-1]|uniref:Uncharacterized protein n=1 Tax=Choiromyces venosus 120613-1 TaxID=1336337 RepID=A0A3N4K9X3_9PEZI|nr:hypothetical protein L873DRAFT_365333 [Choiromyces venosus 120613-1]